MRGTLSLLRRNSRTIAGLVLAGVLIGAGVLLLRPVPRQATALVLVPSASSSNGPSQIGSLSANSNVTDSEIADSTTVLARAGAKVSPALTAAQVKERVSATPVQTNLVQITASAGSARQAEGLANAVAAQLVAFVTLSGTSQGSSVLSGLQAEAAQLTNQLEAINAQIKSTQEQIVNDGNSALAHQAIALLGSLTTAQSNASLQLQSVNSQISSSKLDMAAANVGTEVLQYANSVSPPPFISRIAPVLAGALAGLLVGASAVIVRQRRRRLLTRDEIAEAVGVPVFLSLEVGRWHRGSNWMRLLQNYKLPATEVWDINKALSRLDLLGKPPVLTIVSLAGDAPSMAATVHVALATAATDVATALVLTSDDVSSGGLGAACDRLSVRRGTPRHNLHLSKGSGHLADSDTDLTIVSIVVDPDQPKLPAFVARETVVLMYSAGSANRDQLTRVLLTARSEGVVIKGIIVANPVPGDRTSGALPELNDHAGRILRRRLFTTPHEAMVGGAAER